MQEKLIPNSLNTTTKNLGAKPLLVALMVSDDAAILEVKRMEMISEILRMQSISG